MCPKEIIVKNCWCKKNLVGWWNAMKTRLDFGRTLEAGTSLCLGCCWKFRPMLDIIKLSESLLQIPA